MGRRDRGLYCRCSPEPGNANHKPAAHTPITIHSVSRTPQATASGMATKPLENLSTVSGSSNAETGMRPSLISKWRIGTLVSGRRSKECQPLNPASS